MNHDIEKALDNLEKRAQDIQHYMNIMSKVKTVNVADDQDFQREFDFFYKVRRNAEWRKVFFEIFERKKKKNCSYKEIITELYEGTGQVEASFASKMLASIDENMPIWDSKVLDRIEIKSSNKRGQQKLEETIEYAPGTRSAVDKGKLERQRGIKVVEERAPAAENRRLILGACHRIVDVLIFHCLCIEPTGELAHSVRVHHQIRDRLLGGQGRFPFSGLSGAALLVFCCFQSHPPFPQRPAG